MSAVSRWEDNLTNLLTSTSAQWAEIHRKAGQVRKVRTNPASYNQGDLDMPEGWGSHHD